MSTEKRRNHLTDEAKEQEYVQAAGALEFCITLAANPSREKILASELASAFKGQLMQHRTRVQEVTALNYVEQASAEEVAAAQDFLDRERWQALNAIYPQIMSYLSSGEKSLYEESRRIKPQAPISHLASQAISAVLQKPEKSLKDTFRELLEFSRGVQDRLLEEWKQKNKNIFGGRPSHTKYLETKEGTAMTQLTEMMSWGEKHPPKNQLALITYIHGVEDHFSDRMTSEEKTAFAPFQAIAADSQAYVSTSSASSSAHGSRDSLTVSEKSFRT